MKGEDIKLLLPVASLIIKGTQYLFQDLSLYMRGYEFVKWLITTHGPA